MGREVGDAPNFQRTLILHSLKAGQEEARKQVDHFKVFYKEANPIYSSPDPLKARERGRQVPAGDTQLQDKLWSMHTVLMLTEQRPPSNPALKTLGIPDPITTQGPFPTDSLYYLTLLFSPEAESKTKFY